MLQKIMRQAKDEDMAQFIKTSFYGRLRQGYHPLRAIAATVKEVKAVFGVELDY